jgi:Family of unknown function (DUF6283)
MKWNTREPCKSCPYRRDSRTAFWDKIEFETLLKNDRDPMLGAVYGCHETRKHPIPAICAGWLLDQKSRGLPSIQLRIQLIKFGDEAGECLEQVSSGGHALYDSVEEMIEANFPELLYDAE